METRGSGRCIPVVFVTEEVAQIATSPANPPRRGACVLEGVPHRAVDKPFEGTDFTYMGHLVVRSDPNRPYNFGLRFKDDLVGMIKDLNLRMLVPRKLDRTRFVIVLHIGLGVSRYGAGDMILDKLVPAILDLKRTFPCAAVVFTGPPVKIPADYVHEENKRPVFDCRDYWEFFRMQSFVKFVQAELRQRRPISDGKFLFALRTADIADFAIKYTLPRMTDFFSPISPDSRFRVENLKHFLMFVRFLVSRIFASQADEIVGPQVALDPDLQGLLPPLPVAEVQPATSHSSRHGADRKPPQDQDYRRRDSVPRKRRISDQDDRFRNSSNTVDGGHGGGGGRGEIRLQRGSSILAMLKRELQNGSLQGYTEAELLEVLEKTSLLDSFVSKPKTSRPLDSDLRVRGDSNSPVNGRTGSVDGFVRDMGDQDWRLPAAGVASNNDGPRDMDFRQFGNQAVMNQREEIRARVQPEVVVVPVEPARDFGDCDFRLGGDNSHCNFDSGVERCLVRCEFCGLKLPEDELPEHLETGECPGVEPQLPPPDRCPKPEVWTVVCRHCQKRVPKTEIRVHIRSPACSKNAGAKRKVLLPIPESVRNHRPALLSTPHGASNNDKGQLPGAGPSETRRGLLPMPGTSVGSDNRRVLLRNPDELDRRPGFLQKPVQPTYSQKPEEVQVQQPGGWLPNRDEPRAWSPHPVPEVRHSWSDSPDMEDEIRSTVDALREIRSMDELDPAEAGRLQSLMSELSQAIGLSRNAGIVDF